MSFADLTCDAQFEWMSWHHRDAHFMPLNLPVRCLDVMGAGLFNGVLGFPMCDARGQVIGVRLRRDDGSKFCITGSANGLFIPRLATGDNDQIYVVEGPTDCAALLSIGLQAVGRPSNSVGNDLLFDYLIRCRREIVLFRDRDTKTTAKAATINFARELALGLALVRERVKVISPPRGLKDAREWVTAGATAAAVRCLARNAQAVTIEAATFAEMRWFAPPERIWARWIDRKLAAV